MSDPKPTFGSHQQPAYQNPLDAFSQVIWPRKPTGPRQNSNPKTPGKGKGKMSFNGAKQQAISGRKKSPFG